MEGAVDLLKNLILSQEQQQKLKYLINQFMIEMRNFQLLDTTTSLRRYKAINSLS